MPVSNDDPAAVSGEILPSWLFLDFDGVICDSIEECYQSSRLTESGIEIGAASLPEDTRDDGYRDGFRSARPFIRSGEDYVVLHRLLARGREPGSQAEFDRVLAGLGAAELSNIKRRLYLVRDALLEYHRRLWLGWNPLYPGMAEALARVAGNGRVFIISTKRASFIEEILAFNDVGWPVSRILYSGAERKMAIVESVTGSDRSMLIDDQIDHLVFGHPNCESRLALWGYVSPDAAAAAVPGISLPGCLRLLGRFGEIR